jgi:hypothetical protein
MPREAELRSRHRQQRLAHRLRDALSHAYRVGDLRALVLEERRLVIERLELRRSARLMQEDHPLGRWREVRQTAETAGLRIARLVDAWSGTQQLRCDQRGKRTDADALGGPAEQLAPGQEEIAFVLIHGALRYRQP